MSDAITVDTDHAIRIKQLAASLKKQHEAMQGDDGKSPSLFMVRHCLFLYATVIIIRTLAQAMLSFQPRHVHARRLSLGICLPGGWRDCH